MSSRIFLTARWEWLTMFNFEVDPEILKPHLPPYTEIDYFEGKAIVSVVGFMFNQTRVMGIHWPGHVNFEEVNLRYYIKYFDGKAWKRGVGFISEIVPRLLVSRLANLFYNEHYSTARMKHAIHVGPDLLRVSYEWKKKGRPENSMSVTAQAMPGSILPCSAEEFIFEHYHGYNKLNAATTIEYSLAHPRWQVYPVNSYELNCDVENLYGSAFSPFIINKTPHSVFLARGSAVSVQMPRRIKSPIGSLS